MDRQPPFRLDGIGRARRAGAGRSDPRRQPDDRELVPGLGGVRSGAEPHCRVLPGRRRCADDRPRARSRRDAGRAREGARRWRVASSDGRYGMPGARFDVTLTSNPFGKKAFAAIPELRATPHRHGQHSAGRRPDRRGSRSPRSRGAGQKLLVPLRAARRLRDSGGAPPLGRGSRRAHRHRRSRSSPPWEEASSLRALRGLPGRGPELSALRVHLPRRPRGRLQHLPHGRVREEAHRLPTKEAMLKGLAVAGGVIASAGVVLAGTFSVLAVLPLVALTQIGHLRRVRRSPRYVRRSLGPRARADVRARTADGGRRALGPAIRCGGRACSRARARAGRR